MILDQTLTFVENPLAVTAALLGDVIDLKVAGSAQFQGGVMSVAITLSGAFTGDLQLDLMTHSAVDVDSGVVIDSIYVPNAEALPGLVVKMAINSNSPDLLRYVGIVGVSGTVGLITAGLALDVDSGTKAFADAVN